MRKTTLAALALGCAITAAAQEAVESYEYNEFYYQRSSLFELLPVEEGDIVFFGNSLTNGCEWHELFDNPRIKNRGVSSDVIQGLADRCQAVMSGHPDKVFVLTGVNDISHNLSPDSIAAAMEALIATMKEISPSTRIYLQSMLPINNDFGRYRKLAGKEAVIVESNRLLEQVAERQSVTWIDLYAAFADDQGKLPAHLTNDGLHLLGEGYLVWRDAVAKYVEE